MPTPAIKIQKTADISNGKKPVIRNLAAASMV
jgi:hypothetical protein